MAQWVEWFAKSFEVGIWTRPLPAFVEGHSCDHTSAVCARCVIAPRLKKHSLTSFGKRVYIRAILYLCSRENPKVPIPLVDVPNIKVCVYDVICLVINIYINFLHLEKNFFLYFKMNLHAILQVSHCVVPYCSLHRDNIQTSKSF